ncbi:sterigmatocystin 8-O-methyltransferase [Coccidioides immitis H538.4]|uniref:Sterigmatocystin 8-O-methyltransferase n=1 Tax=Coccidioides immitis H538.4 TaxID=396776 RepID=A0A0J8RMB2_COCIT|nr:sterigmatocystin 8-O-methyltransferase [Coccidioides immitis H538.4]
MGEPSRVDTFEQNGLTAGNVLDESIAVLPNAGEDVPQLLHAVAAFGKEYAAEPRSRMKLLEAARSLVYALETPREAMIRYCWAQSSIFGAIETGIDMGLFHILAKDDKPKTVSELANATKSDPTLLSRILKHLAAMGVVVEAGADLYRPNGLSKTLTIKKYFDGWPCIKVIITEVFPGTGCVTSAAHTMPEFFKSDSPFQMGFNTDLNFFEYLGANPKVGSEFNNHMSAYHQGRSSWMDPGFFPVEGRLFDGAKAEADAPLIVDVGGSLGHDLMEFKKKWPRHPGKLIVQDLPEVIKETRKTVDPNITAMEHDFFKDQPIKGARAYFMHSILHDWPDDIAVKILTNLVKAMEPGYSRLLINENVIPDIDAYWETTSLDIIMLALFSSQERTAKHWHQLLGSVGLKIVNIWTVEKGTESLIECEVV